MEHFLRYSRFGESRQTHGVDRHYGYHARVYNPNTWAKNQEACRKKSKRDLVAVLEGSVSFLRDMKQLGCEACMETTWYGVAKLLFTVWNYLIWRSWAVGRVKKLHDIA